MWGVQDAEDVGDSDKLRTLFGTTARVQPGGVYGSSTDGTARWLAMPSTTHPGDHLSREAIGYTVSWLNATLEGEREAPPPERQIWFWKEGGTLVALVGGVLLLVGTLELLLSRPRFGHLRKPGVGALERPTGRWWITLLAASALPAVTYFPLTALGGMIPANVLLPQEITNQIVVWALGNGLLALPVVLRGKGRLEAHIGAKAAVGALSVAVLYAAVLLMGWVFESDLRFWVVALKPMAWHHVTAFLAYSIPLTAFFYVTQRAFHETVSLAWAGRERQYAIGIVANAAGFTLMLAIIYGLLFTTGHLPAFADPLFTIVAIQFVAVLALTGVVAVFSWRRTDGPMLGAIVCGLLVTWYVVAGQATHV
jgi:hypothetical protein